MADNLRKYTTQEVLNKVYTDSSGDTIGLQAQTSKETLNAVLNTSTNSLNVSLSGSNTISGDVTITGDLTVQGSGGAVYDEIIEGSLHIKTASSGQSTADTAADELVVENSASGGISILTPNDSLGQLAFGSPADAYGAFIGWKSDDNQMTIATANAGDSIVMQTANKVTAVTIDSSQKVGIGVAPSHELTVNNQIGIKRDGTDAFGTLTFDSSGLVLDQSVSGYSPLKIKSNGSEVARFTSDGKFGIGTTSPAELLEIEGTSSAFMQIQSTSADSTSGISLQNDAINYVLRTNGANSDSFEIRDATNNAQRLIIDSSGNVSAGTTATYGNLTVGGTGEIIAGRASSGAGSFSMYEAGTTRFVIESLNGSNGIAFKTPSTARMILDDNSRISLSNNDSGGTGGRDSTSSNTLFGWNAGSNIASGSVVNTFIGHASGSGSLDSAQNNVGVGAETLQALTTGDSNTVMGAYSGFAITTGEDNVIIGTDAGFAVTTQSNLVLVGRSAGDAIDHNDANGTVAIGEHALGKATSAIGNTAIGLNALAENTTGDNNIAIGHNAMNSQQAGGTQGVSATSNNNTFIGVDAGGGNWADSQSNYNVGIGNGVLAGLLNASSQNTALGYAALNVATTSDNNVAIGYYAGVSVTTGGGHVIIGRNAGDAMTTMTDTVLIGYNAGSALNNTNANGTTIVGRDAGERLVSGEGVTLIGNRAGTLMTGSYNTALGHYALATQTGASNNTAFGYEAGRYLGDDGTSNHSSFNTIFGRKAMGGGNTSSPAVNTAHLNTAIGHHALGGSTGTGTALTATGNTAIGYASLSVITNGANNTTLGYGTLQNITGGGNNVAIGNNAGNTTTGSSNLVLIGMNAGDSINSTDANGTVAIGYDSGQAITSAQFTTAVGYKSLTSLTNGDKNTAIGYSAGNTTEGAQKSTFIGYDTEGSGANVNNETVIGADAVGQGGNTVTLGNADVTDVYMAQDKGATVHADYVLSQGNQNHVANTMSSPYYRFDGVDDYIEPSSIGLINSPFSISLYIRNKTHGSGFEAFYSQDSTEIWFGIGGTSEPGRIRIHIGGGSDYADTSDNVITDGVWTHVTATWDGTNAKIYVNGVSQSLSVSGTLNNPASDSARRIGRLSSGSSSNAFSGEVNNLLFWNKTLTATEVKELYSGASVPFKYKGANQTDMVTNGGFADGSNWTISGGWDINTTTSGKARFLKDGSGIDYIEQNVGLVKDKMYRLTFTISDATNAQLAIYNNDTSTYASIQSSSPSFSNFTNTANGTYVVDFLATASGKLVIAGHQNSGSAWDLDDVSLVPIGAVAEYNGSGITENKWYDGSGNELHGTVNGASDENTASAPVLSDNHPAFLVQPNAQQNNIAADSVVDIVFDVERFDQGSNFASNTFTAPVTGKYFLNVSLYGKQVDSASDYLQVYIVTSNRTYTMIIDPDFGQDAAYWSFNNSVLADMDVNDTAKIQVFQSAGASQLDIGTASYFSGYLVC